jgi:hypothetical protein
MLFPRSWFGLFNWIEHTGYGTMIRDSIWQFAAIEAVHLLGSLFMMLLTGYLLMASLAASKYYVNLAFQLKMIFLLLAIVFTFTVRRWLIFKDDTEINPAIAKIVAIVSVLLWSGVGIMGRGIGFY